MVRGNELSHHWTYGQTYGSDPPLFDRDRHKEKKKEKEKEKKKKKKKKKRE